eukprot:8637515-Alexandrium_andersonii.AAC.1
MLERVATGAFVDSFEDLEVALAVCRDARGRFANRSGFPQQRVCGSSTRLPGCLLSDDAVDRLALIETPKGEFHRRAAMRSAALRAQVAQSDAAAVKRVVRGRPRVDQRASLREGVVVEIRRDGKQSGGGRGRGV